MNCHHVEKSCMQFVLIFVNILSPLYLSEKPFFVTLRRKFRDALCK